ncbi:MAG: HAMP domain-containing histidine kinase [Chromatiales bacterium]|nr:HAMP domain-containing histidine kinase [Chromatiales bacterium]
MKAAAPARRLRARLARVPRGSIFRLALLYVLLLAGSVGILLGFIYWSTAGYMDRQTTETIEAEIRGLAEQYRRRGLVGLTALISERVARDPVGASVYLLVDEHFERVVGNLDRWPSESPDAEGWIRFRLREWGTDQADEHEARAQVFLLHSGLMLLVGRDIRDLEATRKLILDALTWGLAITLALALAGAWLMSATLTRRLDAINQTSREIMEGDLTRRIPLSGSGDDFDRLADGLNRMLERIEALMASVRQVSDNIAHDLRTPLTRLRNKLELLAAALPESGEARLLAEEAIVDAEELLATFNALLRIARLESGSRRAGVRPGRSGAPDRGSGRALRTPGRRARTAAGLDGRSVLDHRRWRPRSAVPGDGQSGRQCHQVHSARRTYPARGRDGERGGAGAGRRQWSRHPAGTA